MNKKSFPIVALVGLPNAGKSTLLNKIAGKHLAVTSEIAGTTRDRQYLDLVWNAKAFTLVDTAGLALDAASELDANIQKQIDIALAQADLAVLLADGKEPVSLLDGKLLKKFWQLKKPLVLAVNKLDSPKNLDERLTPFYRLGIKNIFPISAITGRGIGDLLDQIASFLSPAPGISLGPEPIIQTDDGDEASQESGNSIAVSIVGKPNVGKSNLFNAIIKEERVVVSPIPGTTRTAIDSQMTIDDTRYTFIDTAGLKKKEYRQALPDIYGGFQTFKAIRRSDVCFLVIDAAAEITKQDQRVAAEIFNMDKGCIILATKIDLYSPPEKEGWPRSGRGGKKQSPDAYQLLRDRVSLHFPFLWMCPVFFVSAVTGQGLNDAIAAINPIFQTRNKTMDSQTLAEFLSKKLKINPPKLLRDQKKPKVFSLHQVDVNPPKFELLVNHPAAISQQFRKFLENSIIRELDFWGTPNSLKLVGKDKT